MTYIVVMLQTIALVLIIIAIIYSKEEQKLQEELSKIINEIVEEYDKLHKKYKKLLDFKYNIRLIMLKADANKEIFAETIDKIKKELDESTKHI